MIKKLKKTTIFTILLTFMLVCTSFLLAGCFNKTVLPERIELEKQTDNLYLNQIKEINYNVYPKNAKNYTLNFTSSNYDIISFDKRANMIAKDYGEAIITIKVKDTNISQSMKVTVGDGKINYINLKYPASATYYFTGEKIDLSEIEVYGHYESGKEILLDHSECTFDYPEIAQTNTKITVTYKDLPSQEIPITVREDRVIELNIDSMPNKTSYFVGEKFDKTGLEVSLKYYSGKIEKLTDFALDKDILDVGDDKVIISYNDFEKEIAITVKAKRIVSSSSELQQAINEGVESIMLAKGAKFNTNNQIILENAKNITIYAQNKTDLLNGIEIIPFKVIGKIENVRLINFTLSSTGETPAENMIDLSNCTGGSIILKNMHFESSQSNALLLPEDVDISVAYNNCSFKKSM